MKKGAPAGSLASKPSKQPQLVAALLDVAKAWDQPWLPLLSFSTRAAVNKYAVAMPRDPAPEIGQVFDASFSQVLKEVYDGNSAIHDGITALVRDEHSADYAVAGWSLWFVPINAIIVSSSPKNKGTAFYTCSALSTTGEFDLLCRLEPNRVAVFEEGKCYNYVT